MILLKILQEHPIIHISRIHNQWQQNENWYLMFIFSVLVGIFSNFHSYSAYFFIFSFSFHSFILFPLSLVIVQNFKL